MGRPHRCDHGRHSVVRGRVRSHRAGARPACPHPPALLSPGDTHILLAGGWLQRLLASCHHSSNMAEQPLHWCQRNGCATVVLQTLGLIPLQPVNPCCLQEARQALSQYSLLVTVDAKLPVANFGYRSVVPLIIHAHSVGNTRTSHQTRPVPVF